jgi:hypothetical protein
MAKRQASRRISARAVKTSANRAVSHFGRRHSPRIANPLRIPAAELLPRGGRGAKGVLILTGSLSVPWCGIADLRTRAGLAQLPAVFGAADECILLTDSCTGE